MRLCVLRIKITKETVHQYILIIFLVLLYRSRWLAINMVEQEEMDFNNLHIEFEVCVCLCVSE